MLIVAGLALLLSLALVGLSVIVRPRPPALRLWSTPPELVHLGNVRLSGGDLRQALRRRSQRISADPNTSIPAPIDIGRPTPPPVNASADGWPRPSPRFRTGHRCSSRRSVSSGSRSHRARSAGSGGGASSTRGRQGRRRGRRAGGPRRCRRRGRRGRRGRGGVVVVAAVVVVVVGAVVVVVVGAVVVDVVVVVARRSRRRGRRRGRRRPAPSSWSSGPPWSSCRSGRWSSSSPRGRRGRGGGGGRGPFALATLDRDRHVEVLLGAHMQVNMPTGTSPPERVHPPDHEDVAERDLDLSGRPRRDHRGHRRDLHDRLARRHVLGAMSTSGVHASDAVAAAHARMVRPV